MEPERYHDRLAGKVAIVTGAGAGEEGIGIGSAIALLFAREGAAVAILDRDEARARFTCAILEGEGAQAIAIDGDVTDGAYCRAAVAAAVARFGAIDILVNNVGGAGGVGQLGALDEDGWRRSFDLNLASALLMSDAVAPSMLGAGRGAIVNIASLAGLRASGSLGYGPSKAALIALTREIATIHGGDGIRANAIAPGHMFTPFATAMVGAEAREARRKIAPAAIEGDAWDVASAALFLASDEARFITGACLPVDGGVSAVSPMMAQRLLKR